MICFKGSVCQIQTLEGLLRLSRQLIIPLYCNTNSKYLSRPNKKHKNISSQIAELLSITETTPNSIHAHVSKPIVRTEIQ